MLVEQQIAERRERATAAIAKVLERPGKGPYGDYRVQSASGETYRVAMRGPGRFENYCSCPDFARQHVGNLQAHRSPTLAAWQTLWQDARKPQVCKGSRFHLPAIRRHDRRSIAPDGHTIVGHWTDMMTPSHTHGYIVRNGNFHAYDVPSSTRTVIWPVSPAGAFVGFYASDRNHGFLQLPDGSAPITIDPPGDPLGTQAIGINAGGR